MCYEFSAFWKAKARLMQREQREAPPQPPASVAAPAKVDAPPAPQSAPAPAATAERDTAIA